MATAGNSRPGRVLAVLGLIIVLLAGWMLVTGNHSPQLGLDLKGGTTVTLQPKVADGKQGTITDQAINQAVDIINQRVNAFGVAEAEVNAQGSGDNAVIVVSVPGITGSDLVNLIGRTARLTFRPVEQVAAAGPAPTSSPTPTPSPSPSSTGKGQGNGQGNGQGSGGKQGDGTSVSPNPSSTANGALLPRTGDSTSPSPKASGSPSPTPTPTSSADTNAKVQQEFATLDCSQPQKTGAQNVTPNDEPMVACSKDGTAKYLLGPVLVEGSDISSASAGIPPQGTSWAVNLNFNSAGTKKFATATQDLVDNTPPQNEFAIVLDGVVVSAPAVNAAILNGQAEITGQFTQKEAQDLATVLKFGALPLAFDVGEQQTVSPTLGADQLHGGLIAGALGLVLVVVYLLLYYRALALVAVASLVVAAFLTYGSVVLLGQTIGFTLTLAGVAGLIVAIGITADSFIVYFERIRDEVRDGRTLRVALETGWARARRTIIAADFISIIAAVILYVLSVGGVRGFAFALGLTTIIDLVVVFMFTKPLITILARTKFFNSGSKWSGLSPERLGARRKAPAAERRTAVSAGKEA